MVSKYSTMVCSISYLLSCQTPSEFCSPTIQFFLCLWLTVAWKNFVFLSPHFSHSALDLWFHIIFSLTWISLISLLTLLISSVFPCKLSHNSSYWSFFFFSILLTLPNSIQFHFYRCSWHFWSLPIIPSSNSICPGSHAPFTISLHLSSFVHIASKKKCFSSCSLGNVNSIKLSTMSSLYHLNSIIKCTFC